MTSPQPGKQDQAATTTDQVVQVALESFARLGFEDTRLEAIAQESGMTKRMIHYHFGDKRGLYLKALSRAVVQLRPDPDSLVPTSSVPVDGVRQIVETLYDQIDQHPAAARLILMENLFNWADLPKIAPLAEQSEVVLSLDKLLILGQDAGAFRPGIAALDVYAIVAAMCSLKPSHRGTFVNLYDTDLWDEARTKGLRRLVVDTVLSFLTSNMQSAGMSYLDIAPSSTLAAHTDDTGGIYGDGIVADDIFQD